jgi:hypothetical protein
MKDYCDDCGQVEWMCTCEEEINVVQLTSRGWLVLVILPALLVMLGIWQVSSHLWYVGDGGSFLGYCWGTMVECYKGGM